MLPNVLRKFVPCGVTFALCSYFLGRSIKSLSASSSSSSASASSSSSSASASYRPRHPRRPHRRDEHHHHHHDRRYQHPIIIAISIIINAFVVFCRKSLSTIIVIVIIIIVIIIIITVIVTIIVILNNIWGRRWCNSPNIALAIGVLTLSTQELLNTPSSRPASSSLQPLWLSTSKHFQANSCCASGHTPSPRRPHAAASQPRAGASLAGQI